MISFTYHVTKEQFLEAIADESYDVDLTELQEWEDLLAVALGGIREKINLLESSEWDEEVSVSGVPYKVPQSSIKSNG